MERERLIPRVPEGLLLIGLGSIWLGHWWWPGIMVVFGIAQGAADLLRKRYLRAAAVMLIFFGIPLARAAGVSWRLFVPAVLIAIGIIGIVKAFLPELSSRAQDPAGTPVDSYAHTFPGSPSAHGLILQPNMVLWK